MTKDDALKLALEALKQIDDAMPFPVAKLAQKVIREALAENPAQQHDDPDLQDKDPELVEQPHCDDCGGFDPECPLAQPAQQEPMTDEQIAELMKQIWGCASIAPRNAPAFARAIEAKLREKNDAR